VKQVAKEMEDLQERERQRLARNKKAIVQGLTPDPADQQSLLEEPVRDFAPRPAPAIKTEEELEYERE